LVKKIKKERKKKICELAEELVGTPIFEIISEESSKTDIEDSSYDKEDVIENCVLYDRLEKIMEFAKVKDINLFDYIQKVTNTVPSYDETVDEFELIELRPLIDIKKALLLEIGEELDIIKMEYKMQVTPDTPRGVAWKEHTERTLRVRRTN